MPPVRTSPSTCNSSVDSSRTLLLFLVSLQGSCLPIRRTAAESRKQPRPPLFMRSSGKCLESGFAVGEPLSSVRTAGTTGRWAFPFGGKCPLRTADCGAGWWKWSYDTMSSQSSEPTYDWSIALPSRLHASQQTRSPLARCAANAVAFGTPRSKRGRGGAPARCASAVRVANHESHLW